MSIRILRPLSFTFLELTPSALRFPPLYAIERGIKGGEFMPNTAVQS